MPSTEEAKALDGSYAGFQPKPAVEVVIVCMKPLSEKSYVDQAMKNGKGIAWFDDCRIPISVDDKKITERHGNYGETTKSVWNPSGKQMRAPIQENGRFPANLLVSDDSLNDGELRKTGDLTGQQAGHKFGGYGHKEYHREGDSGSYSRYFDLDAWYAQFLIVPKASKSEKNKGLSVKSSNKRPIGVLWNKHEANEFRDSLLRNNHPTVKPVKLFCYLITMFSRAGDLILDPFVGSGTTLVSAKKTGRMVVGIDSDDQPGSCEIAVGRFKGIENELSLEGS